MYAFALAATQQPRYLRYNSKRLKTFHAQKMADKFEAIGISDLKEGSS
jgi:hypothetical protein